MLNGQTEDPSMTGRHHIVVSAENNAYTGWQCKLFYYSCVTRLNHHPIFIVHDTGEQWHPDFYDLVKAGAVVRTAPNYRSTRAHTYCPRNCAGTLIHAVELCDSRDDFIVLFDSDMIFLRRTWFPESLAAAIYTNMNYDRDEVRDAAERLSIAPYLVSARAKELCCGVPYVIPKADARVLADSWLAAIDAFPRLTQGDMMHAFGLAVMKLGLEVTLTNTVDVNYWPYERPCGDIIHYGYGDETWDKRHYFTSEQARNVWSPEVEAPGETILGEILAQIREAALFYDNPNG
jgi:hypothetical protein